MKSAIQFQTRKSRQNGAVLIVSLLFLMVMAVIGVSALSNTSMEEKMSQNFQQQTLAFQAAESSIQDVILRGDAGGSGASDNPFYNVNSDPLLSALDAGLNDTSTVVTHEVDPYGMIPNTQISAHSTVIYRNDGYCPGTSTEVSVCYYYEVTSDVQFSGTGAKTTHVQGLGRPSPNPNAG